MTVALDSVAAYLKSLCDMNDWKSIRVDGGDAGIILYRRGEGCVLVGTDHRILDADIDTGQLERQAVEL
jgi:hypothetical protein